MKNRLTLLWELQTLDFKLDDLESLRGDLPLAVQKLENEMKAIEESITQKQTDIDESLEKKKHNENEVTRLLESQKKFKSQLYQVRNNKEYDALTKEIDHADEQMTKLENENEALIEHVEQLKVEIEEQKPMLDELKTELGDKETDLKSIIEDNESEEAVLKKERDQIVSKIKKSDYSQYMRIRKAKRGVGVATIRRSACSGCHNIVPPQRQLEIRRNNRLFTCEYCGRILVSQEISDSVEEQ